MHDPLTPSRPRRRLPGAGLLVVLALLGGVLVAPPSAEAAARRAAAPTTTYPQAIIGEKVAFVGRIGKTKRPIVLQGRARGKWYTLAKRRTDTKGRYRVGYINRIPDGTAPAYRIVAPAHRGRKKIVSKPVRLPSLTVDFDLVTSGVPYVGQPYPVTIVLAPARPGARLTITYRSDAAGGRSTLSTTLDGASRASITYTPTVAGQQNFQVSSGSGRAGFSTTFGFDALSKP